MSDVRKGTYTASGALEQKGLRTRSGTSQRGYPQGTPFGGSETGVPGPNQHNRMVNIPDVRTGVYSAFAQIVDSPGSTSRIGTRRVYPHMIQTMSDMVWITSRRMITWMHYGCIQGAFCVAYTCGWGVLHHTVWVCTGLEGPRTVKYPV